MPIPSPVLDAAQFVDRSISRQFTKAVLSFLHQNWDDSAPLGRQPWYRKLQASKLPDIVKFEAARAVKGRVFPVSISKVAKLSAHGQKWLAEQRKASEEHHEKATEERRRKAAAPTKHRESKKPRHDIKVNEEEVIELIEQANKTTLVTKPAAVVWLKLVVSPARR